MEQALIEHGLWHPVCAWDTLEALPLSQALAVRLLGTDLVLWRSAPGEVLAFADRCPHRGTRLSLGQVRQGEPGEPGARLECRYHGWQFEASGRCVQVPALPGFVPPATHKACAYAVRIGHGLVWVQLTPSQAELPRFEAEADPRLRKLLCGPYDVQTSAPRVVENFLDMAHFAFVHEGWLGERGHTEVAGHQVAPAAGGFVATGCRAWQPRSNRLSQQGSLVEYRYELLAPFTAVLSKVPQAQQDDRDVIGLFICPMDEEQVRVWFRLAVTDFESSDQALRDFQHQIFTQDQPILESQRPRRLPLGLALGSPASAAADELHCAADRLSAAYRRVLRERGITFGVC